MYNISDMPLVLTSPVICSTNGRSLFAGDSYYQSGRSDYYPGSSPEVRRINIPSRNFQCDDDSSTRSAHADAVETSTEYYPSETLFEVFLRNIDADNANITIHVNKKALRYTSTSVNFNTDFVPSSSKYLVGYIGNDSSNHVSTGGWVSITRI